VVRVEGRVAGAAIEGSLFGTPIDLAGGRVDAELRLDATGYAAAGLLASLGGQVRLTARDGTLAGVELGRIGPGLDEADLRLALAGGRTACKDNRTLFCTVGNKVATTVDHKCRIRTRHVAHNNGTGLDLE
jgi:hypothetical protein